MAALSCTETPNDDFDNPWKTGLERYLRDFLALFCPGLAAGIDWSVEPEFRDQELRQVTRDARTGAKRDPIARLVCPAQEASYRAYLRELERRAKMPYVHSIVRESRQQARLEGLQEGLFEGQLKGRREMLEEMLFSRFGPLPEAVRLRLKLASLEELSRWAGRALVAQSLAEVTRP